MKPKQRVEFTTIFKYVINKVKTYEDQVIIKECN